MDESWRYNLDQLIFFTPLRVGQPHLLVLPIHNWKHTSPSGMDSCLKKSTLNMIKLLDLTTSLQEKWGLKEHVKKLITFWNKMWKKSITPEIFLVSSSLQFHLYSQKQWFSVDLTIDYHTNGVKSYRMHLCMCLASSTKHNVLEILPYCVCVFIYIIGLFLFYCWVVLPYINIP